MSTPTPLGRATLPFAVTLFLGAVAITQETRDPAAAALKNPVAPTRASISAGKAAYDTNCAACHGNKAQGAEKAGVAISIIQEQGGKQPPDLTDEQWDHGSTDGEIFASIKKGLPPTMMMGWGGVLSDTEIWNVVNYLHALAANGGDVTAAVGPAAAPAGPVVPKPVLELTEYARMPITGDPAGKD